MAIELSYRGEHFAVEHLRRREHARGGDLELRPLDGATTLARDWRRSGRRIRRLRRVQALWATALALAVIGGTTGLVLAQDDAIDALARGAADPAAAAADAHAAGHAVIGLVLGLLALGLVLRLAGDRAMRRNLEELETSARLLADLAATDPLTELPNHRAFHERLREEVSRASRDGTRLALVLIDLDHFKRVNDLHGHPAGDRAVREVGRRLAACARHGEIVARVGGEEFGWILPGADGMDAWQAAERARLAISSRPVLDYGHLTLSAGVCELAQAPSASELHRLADGALYWAKAHGRDRAIRYSPEVVEELSVGERALRLEHQQALNAIHALARAVDAKDPHTLRHSERVADLSVRLALELGWPAERLRALREAAVMHDVGKIAVPDAILRKPGPLTDDEFALIREHPGCGADIVAEALTPEQVGWVRGHHERFDGGGYPDGLAGDALSDGARVIGVADAWDAMTSDRPYRPGLTLARALEICRGESGAQFAPEVVAALLRLWESAELGPRDERADERGGGRLVYRGAEAVEVVRAGRALPSGSGLRYRGSRLGPQARSDV